MPGFLAERNYLMHTLYHQAIWQKVSNHSFYSITSEVFGWLRAIPEEQALLGIYLNLRGYLLRLQYTMLM
ncbi:hypothetical protein XBJ2_1140025 [Xenorhabdus bovienii str. Jollieti]|nr:hypothetical protein XBJ2_1140025 [Xenorhabdus bovienii str. Jollieti]